MPVRKINKTDRVKLVTWIRSGAPLSEGVSLYASMPCNTRLLAALQKNPKGFESDLVADICELLGITLAKFESIKKQYYAEKNAKSIKTRKVVKQTRTENRHPKRTGSFRNDWSFLSRPDCPPELKALAADKISAWERYTANHSKLFDCGTLDECSTIAHEIIKDYKENRLIFQEFKHYQKTGRILGEHPVFAHYKRFKRFRGMNVVELVKEQERTKHRIWRKRHEIAKGDKPHLKARREKEIEQAEGELAELNRMLGVNE